MGPQIAALSHSSGLGGGVTVGEFDRNEIFRLRLSLAVLVRLPATWVPYEVLVALEKRSERS